MASSTDEISVNPYILLLNALSLIPILHYLFAFSLFITVFLYNFLEFHFFEDLRSWFRGCPIGLTYRSGSEIYRGVVSKCVILHGRYLPTPWLSSPHIQTCFLNFFGRPPVVNYRRQIFNTSDGGTIALDWLPNSDDFEKTFPVNGSISKEETTPIVVLVPGLTSDSSSAYIKHFAFDMANHGWNVVISNHRGLGGVSVTSDCFYNAGWTEDIRTIINFLHHKYPNAPLFAVGTSIGANILVKYLGEDKENVPLAGAAAVCNPWDLLIGDRFICRRLVQRLYDRALTIGLQGYAQLHEPRYTRLANWEGIKKSRSIRDFDKHATCLVAKYESADTYYRRCSSASYVGNVSVPLLCISALDDPVCTREAIPWDECRTNKNIVLATPKHGGHLAFFEGISATSLWWVGAVTEFLSFLHLSPYMHKQKKIQNSEQHRSMVSSFDKGPYVNVAADGMVAAVGDKQLRNNIMEEDVQDSKEIQPRSTGNIVSDTECDDHIPETKSISVQATAQTSEQVADVPKVKAPDVATNINRHLNQLFKRNNWSMWLLAYIAIFASWPLVGSVFRSIFRKKVKNVSPAALGRK